MIRKRGLPGSPDPGSVPGEAPKPLDEDGMEISVEELREFMEADLVDVHADPEFKHSLRERLWAMVQARNSRRLRGPGRL